MSYADENGDFQIAVVCDGHGDPACLRSAYGSKALSEIATDCLKEYALGVLSDEEYKKSNREELLLEKSQNILVRRLTDIIISKWYDRIFADLKEHPLTEEDIASSGRYQPYYEKGERLEHVYGTTLIAALHMDDLLLLLQQGDGRCDVFFEDGTVEQPIPWDDRCFENVTTSMCDEDVTSSIRHQVLDLKKRPVIACYMGSDGMRIPILIWREPIPFTVPFLWKKSAEKELKVWRSIWKGICRSSVRGEAETMFLLREL